MITIGIPVCNEGEYLQKTLDSIIMNLSMIDKIILTDNFSTDNTQEICLSYARQYEKIKYIRHEKLIPAIDNWKTSLDYAKTKYFMWIAGHDLISPNYIESLVNLLEKNQDAVVATSKIYRFNKEVSAGKLVMDFSTSQYDSESVAERIEAVIDKLESCYVVNQVWKREIICEVMNEIKFEWICSDVIMGMHAALKGRIVSDSRAAYYYRIHRKEETEEETQKRYEIASGAKLSKINPHQYIIKEWWRLIGRYAPKLKDEGLRYRLEEMCPKVLGVDVHNSMWAIRNGRKIAQEKVLDLCKIKKILTNSEKVYVLFGAGTCGETFYQYIKTYVNICYFVDSSIEKQQVRIDEKMIFSPKILEENNKNIIVIVGEFRYLDEMRHEMERMGFVYGETMYSYQDFLLRDEEIWR